MDSVEQLGNWHGIDLDSLHLGNNCEACSFVRLLAVGPGPVFDT